ncbi:Uncharacterized protein OS=Thiorhodovibrio sp. 970 GN=Thi970DRAFT_01321 PE=4 SV=1: zf-trcl [Gemmata massiliana]|uniref:Probable zinc-binding domain-containing protein n=1 Tax=Gemmata massiliana TaxID=1210884 RepID=A0A6P2D6S2_9BACT|nr:Uncharacterized protein OS=Thiorhodovibrio sp. 970 GN=Thi970DRAFT_01321 PE=4 SV=1: zf-trcl [Gemmata massiliana]
MGRGKPRHDGSDKRRESRVPADTSQQAPNNSYSPLTQYEDTPFTCADCGKEEIWTAAQQKWWYEVAKGTIYSRAIRCRSCRQALRKGGV